jgi:hypothetical protein
MKGGERRWRKGEQRSRQISDMLAYVGNRAVAKKMLNMQVECAGINRQEAENENFSRARSSEPLGPEFCAVGREAWSEA